MLRACPRHGRAFCREACPMGTGRRGVSASVYAQSLDVPLPAWSIRQWRSIPAGERHLLSLIEEWRVGLRTGEPESPPWCDLSHASAFHWRGVATACRVDRRVELQLLSGRRAQYGCARGSARCDRSWTPSSRPRQPPDRGASHPPAFTGLSPRLFGRPVTALRREGADVVRRGRLWGLPLEDRVLLVAAYWRRLEVARSGHAPCGCPRRS